MNRQGSRRSAGRGNLHGEQSMLSTLDQAVAHEHLSRGYHRSKSRSMTSISESDRHHKLNLESANCCRRA